MGRPPITQEQRRDRNRQRVRDWKLTHPHEVKLQKKRYKHKAAQKRKDSPPPAAKKDPTGELEYSPLDGIDIPYAESPADNGPLPHRADAGSRPGAGRPAPGIDDPLGCLDPLAESESPQMAPGPGIPEPADFLEDLEAEHKRAMLAHLRGELEASYDRDKERLRQSFGTGKV